MRTAWITAALLVLLLVLCLGLEGHEDLVAARRAFQSQAVPTSMLNRGNFGRVLKQLELVGAVPNDESLFSRTEEVGGELEHGVFATKRAVGDLLYEARPRRGADMPSSRIMAEADVAHGRPVLSVVVDEADLHDELKGIVARYGARGRKWERLAQVSYYDDGQLQFATAAGIRLHGGGTHRETNQSFRLYFRQSYGVAGMPSHFLGERGLAPVRTLVVRKHWYRGHVYTAAVAHELAAKMGATVGDLKMADFYLNGEYQGPYHLTEHVSPKQWASHLDPPDREAHYFYRLRSTSDDAGVIAYYDLNAWSIGLVDHCSLDDAARWVDLEALVRHVFVFAFCGTTDWRQGMAVRSREPGSLWRWVTWDLDHSFADVHPVQSVSREPWEQPALILLVTGRRWDKKYPPIPWQSQDVRCRIMRSLLLESPEFRTLFSELAMDIMNHEIPPAYLAGLAQRYSAMARDMGRMDEMLGALPDFFEYRPDFIRQSFREHLDLGRVVSLEVDGPQGSVVLIDGYEETLPYMGYYFAGRDVSLVATDSAAETVWRIAGEKRHGLDASFRVEDDTRVVYQPGH